MHPTAMINRHHRLYTDKPIEIGECCLRILRIDG